MQAPQYRQESIDKHMGNWKLFSYTLPLHHPTLKQRHGLLVELRDSQGRSGWGEISPFDLLSRESLPQARAQTLDFLKHKVAMDTLFPSVRFGLESALSSLQSNPPTEALPLSALLLGSPEEILNRADRAEQQGFRTAKVKIGDLTLSQAQSVLQALQGRFLLRLDGNRKWPLQKTLTLLSTIDLSALDYIEEPVDHPSDLLCFPFPFALDESLPHLTQMHAIPHNLKALIIKPTILGGACSQWISFAKKHHLQLILSSTYESGIGLMQIAQLAHTLKLTQYSHGLGTYAYLADDLLQHPLTITNGTLLFHRSEPNLLHPYLHLQSTS